MLRGDLLKVVLGCDKCTYDQEHWHTFGLASAAVVPQANIVGAIELTDGETSSGGPLTQQVSKYLVDRQEIQLLGGENVGTEQLAFLFANDDQYKKVTSHSNVLSVATFTTVLANERSVRTA